MATERALAGKDLVLFRGINDRGVSDVDTTAGGTGYTSAPMVIFEGGGGSGAAATAALSGSSVGIITVTNPGTGYITPPTIRFSGGGGTGATATSDLEDETYELLPCLTSNDINQTSTTISTETKCEDIKLPGTQDAVVPFAFVPKLSPDAGKVAMATIQNDFKNRVTSNWKATTQDPVKDDPIFSFRGFLTELSWKAGTNDAFNGSSSIQVDGDGVALSFVP